MVDCIYMRMEGKAVCGFAKVMQLQARVHAAPHTEQLSCSLTVWAPKVSSWTQRAGHSCQHRLLRLARPAPAWHHPHSSAPSLCSSKVEDALFTFVIQPPSRALSPAACSRVSTRGCTQDTCTQQGTSRPGATLSGACSH